MRPVSSFVDRQYFLNSIPFYGKGSNYITNQSGFNGGISVKFAALKDMSFPEEHKRTDFDRMISYYQGFRVGSRCQGQMVNTGFNGKTKPQIIIGKLYGIKIDRKHKQFQAFIHDPATNDTYEVYAHTLSPLMESIVKTFDDFILQD
jgi:hypothetical protein